MPPSLFQINPVEIAILVIGFVVTWTTLRNTAAFHTKWIETHDKECEEHKKAVNAILAKLTILADTHDHRIERLENQQDRRSE